MNALDRTSTVLHRSAIAAEPPADGIRFQQYVDADEQDRAHVLYLDPNVWDDMGQPDTITITITPGDHLNHSKDTPLP